MKMKKVNGLGANISLLVFCFGLLVAAPVRIMLMLKDIDPSTGFYKSGNHPLMYVLYAALGVVGLCLIIFPKISKRTPPTLELKEKNIPLAIFSLLFAVGLVQETLVKLLGDTSNGVTLVQSATTMNLMNKLEAAFAFISAVYFIILFACLLFGSNAYKKLSIFPLAPVCWAIFSIMDRLILIINYRRISDLFLEMIALIFVMIFFLSFARIVSNTNPGNAMSNLIGSGLTASLVILSYSIPRLVLTVIGKKELLATGYGVKYAHLAAAAFIIVTVIVFLRHGTPVASDEQSEPQAQGTTTITFVEDGESEPQADSETEKPQKRPIAEPKTDENGNIVFK